MFSRFSACLGTTTAAVGLLALLSAHDAKSAAFPTAQGYGANAVGGRGGSVCQVTSLADTGTGTLRDCLTRSGARTIVFRIGGTITLNSQINVTNGYFTLAGQTAPGGGILVRGSSSLTGDVIRLSDTVQHAIIRHIRLRRGQGGSSGTTPIEGDPLEIRGQNVIVDHVSASWGNDQVISTSTGADSVTISNSILAEGLYRANNPEGPHSMGPLLYKVNNITMYRNIMAHNQERNPRVNNTGITDIVNNIIYNPGSVPTVASSDWGTVSINYVNNYYKKGPNSPTSNYAITCRVTNNTIGAYGSGNTLPNGNTEPTTESTCRSGTRFNAPAVTTVSASHAYTELLAASGAGALPRDAVDARIVGDVANGTGAIINDPSDVGGWPTIAGGTPYTDADADGMDDAWETANNLSPSNAADRNSDADGDGYTNLEEFLAEKAGDQGAANPPPPPPPASSDSGWKNVATTAVDTASGGSVTWSNPGNIVSDNNAYATASFTPANAKTNWIKGTNLGLAIPTGATIKGVEVQFSAKVGTGSQPWTISDVMLIKGGTVRDWSDQASGQVIDTTEQWYEFGNATTLWGLSLTPADVNRSDFGVAIALEADPSATSAIDIDAVQVKVYY